MKTKRQIIEEMIATYLEMNDLVDKLSELSISLEGYDTGFNRYARMMNWALDLIGFPPDTTATDDDGFCRDYLSYEAFEDVATGNKSGKIKDYVDWLYQKFDEYQNVEA